MINPSQIRAARSFLNIDQQVVADAVGVSKANISDTENEKSVPKASTMAAIQKFYELRGVEFTADGGIRPANSLVQIYEGNDAYLRLLDDVAATLPRGGVLLKSGTDERKSSLEVIEKNRQIRSSKIEMRNLIETGNTHILGNLDEYRYMPNDLFVEGDVKLIYGDRVAYMVIWLNVPKAIIIHDKIIASEARRVFEYIWKTAEAPDKTTAKDRYEAE